MMGFLFSCFLNDDCSNGGNGQPVSCKVMLMC